MCERTTFEVLDCEVEVTLSMPFLKEFNPEIDWTTSTTTITEHTLPLIDHKAYSSSSRLEIVSDKLLLGF